jgi:hypothetical protein
VAGRAGGPSTAVSRRLEPYEMSCGTVVSLYEDAALVEVAEGDPPGSALDDLLSVPFDQVELGWSHRTGPVDGWKPDGSLNGRDRAAERSPTSE